MTAVSTLEIGQVKLEAKLDSFGDAIKQSLELSRQTLDELKRTNDVFTLNIEGLKGENSRLWEQINKNTDINREAHKKIYERLEKVEEDLKLYKGLSGINSDEFAKHASKWMNARIAERVCWAAGIVLAVLAAIWFEGYVRH